MSTVDLTIDEEPREEQPAPPEDLPPQPISDNVSSGPNPRPVTLPVSRIKTIMKSCPDTSMVSQEAAVLVTKSTERFIEEFTKEALKVHQDTNSSSKDLEYKDLSHLVQDGSKKWQFLKDIVPHKILVRDYLEMLDRQKAIESAKKT
ncbi:chromatin accessibility complex protein 1-like [Dysidea avara]|uniref:chromatin accessibility complex protein 1-like n=1 Tax=Dysidea avara TaxID=196820 RepID=UPI00331EFA84